MTDSRVQPKSRTLSKNFQQTFTCPCRGKRLTKTNKKSIIKTWSPKQMKLYMYYVAMTFHKKRKLLTFYRPC